MQGLIRAAVVGVGAFGRHHARVYHELRAQGVELVGLVDIDPEGPRALADQYGKVGLGPERADQMVRLGDVTRAGISWSLHSDMPMAPGDPLFLMWCAVNRVTASGRVAGPDQRVTAEDALRGVTLEAAYSLKLEDEVGSIAPGKRANLTILDENPLTVDTMKIKDIKVRATVMEGRKLPTGHGGTNKGATKRASLQRPQGAVRDGAVEFTQAALRHALIVGHGHD